MAQNSQFTLYLIGLVGHGKSGFCNFLFREQRFQEKTSFSILTNPKSQIFNTNISTVEHKGTQITLYDFPGFLDYRFPSEKIYNEIREAGLNANPDCFGYVISFSERMSAAEFKDMHAMIESFGTNVWKHLFVIFTYEDSATKDFPGQTGREAVESILNRDEVPDALEYLMPRINKRYMILDSKTHEGDEEYWNSAFTELIGLMNEVRELNRGVPFDGKQLGPGMESYVEYEKREKVKEKETRETFQRNMANLMTQYPTPPVFPAERIFPNTNPVLVKPSIFSRVRVYLKNFYMTHPNYVLFFVMTGSFSLLLCCNFVYRSLKLNLSNLVTIFRSPKF